MSLFVIAYIVWFELLILAAIKILMLTNLFKKIGVKNLKEFKNTVLS